MRLKKDNFVKKAFDDMEAAWKEIYETPVKMTVDEFEERLLKMADEKGIEYSEKKGHWLDIAKMSLIDPRTPQQQRNLILAEVEPPELKGAIDKFQKAFMELHGAAEFIFEQTHEFINDSEKDPSLIMFLRWRLMPVVEAYYKLGRKNIQGLSDFSELCPCVSICKRI